MQVRLPLSTGTLYGISMVSITAALVNLLAMITIIIIYYYHAFH